MHSRVALIRRHFNVKSVLSRAHWLGSAFMLSIYVHRKSLEHHWKNQIIKYNTTTLTRNPHIMHNFFYSYKFFSFSLFNFFFLRQHGGLRNVFLHNRAANDWETKIVFLWFSNNHSCLCWCFSFFSQRSTRSSLMLFFSSLAAWYYYFQLFFSFFLPLTTFLSCFSQTPSLTRSHSLTYSMCCVLCRWKYSSSLLQTIFYYDMIMWNCIIIIATDVFNNWLRLWNWIFTLSALRVRGR